MAPNTIVLGSLVQHRYRPGVWRVLGYSRLRELVTIEAWDDQAAASLHASEAYELHVPARLIRPLRPGRSAGQLAGNRPRGLVAMG